MNQDQPFIRLSCREIRRLEEEEGVQKKVKSPSGLFKTCSFSSIVLGKHSECKVFIAFIQVLSGFKDWQVLTIFLQSRLLFRQVFSSSCFMSFGERFWLEMFRRKSVCSLWRLLIPGKTSGKLHLTKISQKMFVRI